jgi:LPS sulfotransferase NodH
MTAARRYLLIFAHPRSGSTTLAQVLNLHPELRILEEPFGDRAARCVEDLDESLEALVKEPWSATGIKHVYNFAWPFPPDQADQCNRHLLLRPGWVVVFLWRRNLFEAALSNVIAQQLQAWDTATGKQRLQERPALRAVPVPSFRSCFRQLQRQIAAYRDCLVANDRPFIEITYEELFGDDVSPGKQMDRVNEILRAAGYPEIREGAEAEAMRRLMAKDNKVNSQATYELIPNYEELRRACDEALRAPW